MVALPGERAGEQAGIALPVRDPLLCPGERLLGGRIGGEPGHRLVRELDRLGDPADIEVGERDQQRGVVRRLPVRARQRVGRRAIEDLAAPVLRLGERLARAADLAEPAHAIEVRGAELGRRDGGSIRPPVALLAALLVRELERVVVAGVRVRRHQAGRDALVPHAHVLEGADRRERLAPDREVRLGVHRRLLHQRQDVPPIHLAREQPGDVLVAARGRVCGIDPEDRGVEQAALVARELGEHAEERHGEPRWRLRQATRELLQIDALLEHPVGLRQTLRRDAQIAQREVGERAHRR